MTKDTVYLPFYFEWAEYLYHLRDDDYGRLVKAILAFAMGKPESRKMSPEAKMAYNLITATIARAEAKRYAKLATGYESGATFDAAERVEYRREAVETGAADGATRSAVWQGDGCEGDLSSAGGTLGIGESKGCCDAGEKGNRRKPKKVFVRVERKKNAEEPKADAKVADSPTNIENSDDICVPSDTYIDKNAYFETQKATSEENRIPTLSEVQNYFAKQEFNGNPDEFYHFYESKGWMVGPNPMINWHAAARSWEIRTNNPHSPFCSAPKQASIPHEEPVRYGNFDVHEAFALALKRSYEDPDDDDDDDDDEIDI